MFIREIEALRGVIRQETATRPAALAQVRRVNGTRADLALAGSNTLVRAVPIPAGTLAGATVEVAWQGNRPVVSRAAPTATLRGAGSLTLPSGAGAGPGHHGHLAGLGGDDHPHYLTSGRGDLRYTPLAHAANLANPHVVTAAQVGAVAKSGDTMTGALTLPTDGLTLPVTDDTVSDLFFKIPFFDAVGNLKTADAGLFFNPFRHRISMSSVVFGLSELTWPAATSSPMFYRTSGSEATYPFRTSDAGVLVIQARSNSSTLRGITFVTGNNTGSGLTPRLTIQGPGSVVIGGSPEVAASALLHIRNVTAATVAAIVQAAASQTANLQEWRNAGGTVLASISSAGEPTFPSLRATASGVSFFGVSPAGRPAAYTLAGTATRVLPTLPADYGGLAAGGAGTPYAAVADLNHLKARVAELEGVLRQLLTDHATYGLLQTT